MNTLSMTLDKSDNFKEAVRLEGTIQGEYGAATPGPSTIVLAGVGVLALVAGRLRK